MSYDFDKIIDRKSSLFYKWQIGENELPMWVDDNDFQTAPCVVEEIEKRVK